MIILHVKVRRDLWNAFVNLDSVGMDKIAQVTEFLSFSKAIKAKIWCSYLYGNKPVQINS